MTDFAAARANMVESQIRPNKVTDPALIRALATLPRERFVRAERRPLAYVDEDLALGGGRFLMEPMVLARLIQTAAPEAGEIALVVGCGTGYAAAVLSRVCEMVIGIGIGQGACRARGGDAHRSRHRQRPDRRGPGACGLSESGALRCDTV